MKLAFCLFKVFPFGGLQRDFLRIARACQERQHEIQVFTSSWQGDTPPGFKVNLLPARGWSNHQRIRNFSSDLTGRLSKQRFDAVVGFNKLPGLDVYFAADPCYEAKVRETKAGWYRWTARYRAYRELERSVFSPAKKTRILLLTEAQREAFIHYYGTPKERFHLLPPGIDRRPFEFPDRRRVSLEARRRLGVGDDDLLLLMVGSGFKTKGVDRSIEAVAALPTAWRTRARLQIAGQGDSAPFLRLAKKHGLGDRVTFLGPRQDVPELLTGADLLLQPSRTEAAGMVLIEAMFAGLPVLCTDVCGYAFHVQRAGSGRVIPSPFQQKGMNDYLLELVTSSGTRADHSRQALRYTEATDLSSLPEKAVAIIESLPI